jgi:hypothetical protein
MSYGLNPSSALSISVDVDVQKYSFGPYTLTGRKITGIVWILIFYIYVVILFLGLVLMLAWSVD